MLLKRMKREYMKTNKFPKSLGSTNSIVFIKVYKLDTFTFRHRIFISVHVCYTNKNVNFILKCRKIQSVSSSINRCLSVYDLLCPPVSTSAGKLLYGVLVQKIRLKRKLSPIMIYCELHNDRKSKLIGKSSVKSKHIYLVPV